VAIVAQLARGSNRAPGRPIAPATVPTCGSFPVE
jgi:hypothetical protein